MKRIISVSFVLVLAVLIGIAYAGPKHGATEFTGAVTMNAIASVASTLTATGAIDANSTSDFAKTVVIQGALDANSTSDFAKTVVLAGPLDANDVSNFAKTVTLQGGFDMGGQLMTNSIGSRMTTPYTGDYVMKWPAEDGLRNWNFVINANNNSYGARSNNVFRMGWNIGAGGTREDAGTGNTAMAIEFEQHYAPDSTVVWYEMHMPSYYNSAGTNLRILSFVTHKQTDVTTGGFVLDALTIKSTQDKKDGEGEYVKFTKGTISIADTTTMLFTVNNYYPIHQRNAAGNGNISMFGLNSLDQVVVNASGGPTKIGGELIYGAEGAFNAGSAAPTVSSKNMYKLASSSGTTTITDFTGGLAGQMLLLRAQDANTDITDGGNLTLNGNFVGDANDTILLYTHNGTTWFELSRSAN